MTGKTGKRLWISRALLLRRIMGARQAVVVIEAPAGCGKSALLAALSRRTGVPVCHDAQAAGGGKGWVLWDVPNTSARVTLPVHEGRIVMALRPSTVVDGLARAQLYGEVLRIGAEELLFCAAQLAGHVPDPEAVVAATGGWPCLVGAGIVDANAGDNRPLLAGYLREEILAPLPSPALAAFAMQLTHSAAGKALGPSDIWPTLPFATPAVPARLHPVIKALRAPMRRAVEQEIMHRMNIPAQGRAIALFQRDMGHFPEAIATFQALGDWPGALDALGRGHGLFFGLRYGGEAMERVVSGFPPALQRTDTLLVLCRAMQAAKQGEILLARRILADRWGDIALDTIDTLTKGHDLPVDVRFFRFMLHTWEESEGDARYPELGYDLLAAIPQNDTLRHGAFYNALVEFYAQARRFAQAEDVAVRAAQRYERAGVPLLSFYISLHRGIGALFLGNPPAARAHKQEAARALALVGFESPGDARLLALLEACIAYETGQSEPLARFLSRDLEALTQGEIWPSLVELILTYGSQSLAEHYGTAAAQSFLERWRAAQDRLRQFRALIDIREIIVLQNGNRWHEAQSSARLLTTRITRAFVEGAGADLCLLQDRDEVAMAMLWLRQMVQERSTSPALAEQLRALLANPHLTARQRIGAEIWLAHCLHHNGEKPEARTQLTRTLTAADRAGSLAILSEERMFLTDLTAGQRQREMLERAEPVRRVLRRLAQMGPGRAGRGRALGLTRQEMRVLHVLAEGLTDKAIANRLHVSEATVKFHLRNLYRKLGCHTRREAVARASAQGVIS